jgi:hypothetical protein
VVSLVLALFLPAGIGFAVRAIAPTDSKKGGVLRTVVGGSPMTLGFAVACLVTVVTVPIVKIATMARHWSDEHIYAQPMRGCYERAISELTKACHLAGSDPTVGDVPAIMSLGTRVMKVFAKGTLTALVADNPRRIRSKRVELYLYPGDLLLRGDAECVASVRAKMERTALVRVAYLVAAPASQRVQDEIVSLWEAPRAGGRQESIRAQSTGLVDKLEHAKIPYAE